MSRELWKDESFSPRLAKDRIHMRQRSKKSVRLSWEIYAHYQYQHLALYQIDTTTQAHFYEHRILLNTFAFRKKRKKKKKKYLCTSTCQHEIWRLFTSQASCSQPWQCSHFSSTSDHTHFSLESLLAKIFHYWGKKSFLKKKLKKKVFSVFLIIHFIICYGITWILNDEIVVINKWVLKMVWFMLSKA